MKRLGERAKLRSEVSGQQGLRSGSEAFASVASHVDEAQASFITEQRRTQASECCICIFIKTHHLQDIKTILGDDYGKGVITFVRLPNQSV